MVCVHLCLCQPRIQFVFVFAWGELPEMLLVGRKTSCYNFNDDGRRIFDLPILHL